MQADEDGIDWDGIKTDYDSGVLTIDKLCRRHRVSHGRLYRRVKNDGWTKRVESKSGWGGASTVPKALVERLRNTISRRIRMIEKRSHGTARGETALESERQARAIAALVRALEQVIALEQRLAAAGTTNKDKGEDAAWRAKLAQALEQILGAGIRPSAEKAQQDAPDADSDRPLGGNGAAGPVSADRG